MKKYYSPKLLDLGSGSGSVEETYSIDYAIDLHDDSAKRYTKFIKHDLCKKPYPLDKKFKTILCLGTLHYIEEPDLLLKEVKRLLSADGHFILSFNMSKKIANWWANKWKCPIKHQDLTREQLIKLLNKNNFIIIKEYYNVSLNLLHGWTFLWRLINPNKVYMVCKLNTIQ